MNESFLCCVDCREATLVGHGFMLYLAEPKAMEALQWFFAKHSGHQLVHGDENLLYNSGFKSALWEEFISDYGGN